MVRKPLSNDRANGIALKIDNVPALIKSLERLATLDVLVGVPEENADREDDGEKKEGITNASLAYIHDNGAPEVNIPARPFMVPGMNDAKPEITPVLVKMAQYAIAGNHLKVDEGFERVGMVCVKHIQKRITDGIPPPLSERTLQARARKGRKGAQKELDQRGQGLPPGMALAKPLIDTGEMLKSITYVTRERGRKKK